MHIHSKVFLYYKFIMRAREREREKEGERERERDREIWSSIIEGSRKRDRECI